MSKRNYHQFCGVAKALDVVGERWTLLIVRDLLLGPRRYSDLQASLEGITSNLLAQRLREMRERGLVERLQLPPPAGSRVYALTELGRSLESVVLALGSFGARYLTNPSREDRVSARWAMVSLMRRSKGCTRSRVIELQIDDTVYQGRLTEAGLQMSDGAPWEPDVRVCGPLASHAQWIRGQIPMGELIKQGALRREGSAQALKDFERSLR